MFIRLCLVECIPTFKRKVDSQVVANCMKVLLVDGDKTKARNITIRHIIFALNEAAGAPTTSRLVLHRRNRKRHKSMVGVI
jgi:hypothetical protein